jgi:hypothetical protein
MNIIPLKLIIGLIIMGVNYSVTIENQIVERSESNVSINCLTPEYILNTLRSMESYSVVQGIEAGIWQASIECNDDEMIHTNIIGFGYQSDDKPIHLIFEKGDPKLIIEITSLLSKSCGNLIISPDTGERPLQVNRNTNIKKALREWEHTKNL